MIIFLDIDGVLNSTRSCIAKIGPTSATSELVKQLGAIPTGVRFALRTADPVCVALLNMILSKAPGATLVLSSSHRIYFSLGIIYYGSAPHLGALREYLLAMGINVPEKFSITSNRPCLRGEQIKQWLSEHNAEDEQHAIIDDCHEFSADQALVPVNAHYGFSETDYDSTCRYLGLDTLSPIII